MRTRKPLLSRFNLSSTNRSQDPYHNTANNRNCPAPIGASGTGVYYGHKAYEIDLARLTERVAPKGTGRQAFCPQTN